MNDLNAGVVRSQLRDPYDNTLAGTVDGLLRVARDPTVLTLSASASRSV